MEENKNVYDVVALIDNVRRSKLLSDEELEDFMGFTRNKSFFTNRYKVNSEDFDSSVTEKPYFDKIKELLERDRYSYRF